MKPSFLIATITIKSLFTDVWTTISLFSIIGASSCHCLSKTNHDNCYYLIVHWEVGWLSLFKERGFVIYEIRRSFIVMFIRLLRKKFKSLYLKEAFKLNFYLSWGCMISYKLDLDETNFWLFTVFRLKCASNQGGAITNISSGNTWYHLLICTLKQSWRKTIFH